MCKIQLSTLIQKVYVLIIEQHIMIIFRIVRLSWILVSSLKAEEA